VVLHWSKPVHAGENIVSYELYWNDTYAEVGAYIRSRRRD
jgi:receptor-type tyrosine-protein phosphatase F